MSTYVPPTVTVDGVVFQLLEDALHLLLIKRAQAPFKGEWALPGSLVGRNETTTEALARTLAAKAGIDTGQLGFLEQLYTFDTPAALDPRGHAVSVIYLALGKDLAPAQAAGTQSPTFFPLATLPRLAYRHAGIIRAAHQRLQNKVTYTNAIFALLPVTFTFSQLQAAYEAVLGRTLDKRNFRKKFLSLGLITPTSEYHAAGPHRPAQLYRFSSAALHVLPSRF